MATSPADLRRLIGGLAAAVILLLGITGWRSVTGDPTAAVALPPGTGDVASLIEHLGPTADSLMKPPRRVTTVTLERDPFALTRVTAPPPPQPTLDEATRAERLDITGEGQGQTVKVNAILVAGSTRSAVINDALLNVGDHLPDGTRVTAVETDYVILTDTKGNKRKILVASPSDGTQR